MTSAYPAPVPFFGLFNLPAIWPEDRALSERLSVVHLYHRPRHRGGRGHAYRRRAVPPFRAQGSRPDAHDLRLMPAMADAPTSRVLGELTFQDAARAIKDDVDPVPAARRHRAARPAPAAQHRRDRRRGTDAAGCSSAGARSSICGSSRRCRSGSRASTTGRPARSACRSRALPAICATLPATIVRSLPARNLAIVNGHGGNRGILENLLHELHGDFGLNACVLHPFDLAGADPAGADVHGGKGETSVMLALAPERGAARPDRNRRSARPEGRAGADLRSRRDLALAHRRSRGSPATASSAMRPARRPSSARRCSIGWSTAAGGVFTRLLENQKLMRRSTPRRGCAAGDRARQRRPGSPARTSSRSGIPRRPRTGRTTAHRRWPSRSRRRRRRPTASRAAARRTRTTAIASSEPEARCGTATLGLSASCTPIIAMKNGRSCACDAVRGPSRSSTGSVRLSLGEECPHERRAVLQIGEGMRQRRRRARPRPGAACRRSCRPCARAAASRSGRARCVQ